MGGDPSSPPRLRAAPCLPVLSVRAFLLGASQPLHGEWSKERPDAPVSEWGMGWGAGFGLSGCLAVPPGGVSAPCLLGSGV